MANGGANPRPDQPGGASQPHSPAAKQFTAEGRAKNVNTFQATVNEKLKYLKEAGRHLRVELVKSGFGRTGYWSWRLPPA